MQRVTRNRWRQHLLFGAHVFGLLAVFYFYVLLRIRPELFYHQNPVVFLFASEFFAGFTDHPGGLVEYVSAFLSPLFAYGWLGALVVTLLATLICLATRQFFTAVAGVSGQVVFVIPAVLILMVLGQYSHPVRLCVGLFVALVFTNAYVRIGVGSQVAVRLTAFLIGSALAYYVAAGQYVVFACLCAVFELGVKRHLLLGALCLLCAAVVPIAAGAWLFDLSYSEAYGGRMLASGGHWLATPLSVPTAMTIRAGLLLFFPVAAIALVWRRRRSGSPVFDPEGQTGGESPAEDADVSNRPISGVRLAVQLAALVGLGVGADVVSFDSSQKCRLEISYSAQHRRWADVLTHARRLPPPDTNMLDVGIAFHVNRALYFRGDLLDRMFAYPQALDISTLALVRKRAATMAQTTPLECSDILFDLGRINESEHMAYEALEIYGDRPHILKRLVYINVLTGEPEAARRFLALLERSLLHRRWARRLRRQLDADPMLSDVPMVASRRELMVIRDALGEVERLEAMLEGLLERDPQNRMAFEYLMAHYLLTRQIDKLVANLSRFDDFDYPRFPRHCEEALVIYLEAAGQQAPDLGGREIRPEARRRFSEYVRTLQAFRGDVPAALPALHRDFGDSYFFYNMFGTNNLPSGQSRPTR